MSAPNPWLKDLGCVEFTGILEKGEHPLDLIRDFILNWPGEETVKLDSLTRHNRLVQILAGYPEIDVGRYPLDWPLSNKAAKALRLTRYLDSIHSPDIHNSTSLRSALINASYHMKKLEGKDFQKAHRRLLALLILGLKSATGEQLSKNLSVYEHKFLVALHSNSQDRVSSYWPLRELINLENNGHTQEWSFKNYLPLIDEGHIGKQLSKKWSSHRDIISGPEGDIVTVKMKKIQDWIKNWSDNGDTLSRFDSTLIRGASAILESTMSTFRSTIIKQYGVESIVVDGGGRIQFIGDKNSKSTLDEAFKHVFRIRDGVVPYFNNEIKTVIRSLVNKEGDLKFNDFWSLYGIDSDAKGNDVEEEIEIWVRKHLPDLSIDLMKDWTEQEEEPVVFEKINNHNCIFCNNSEPEDKKIMNNWNSFFSDYQKICSFHRLLFRVGKAQRMVNSTVKNSGLPLLLSDDPQRKVIAISRLDLNSLGVLFTKKFNESVENSNDLRRRRSIRFNSQWWCLVKNVLDDEDSEIDRIVSWVAAGDDLVLADYTGNKGPVKSKLYDVLERLADELEKLSDAEYGKFRISFGAGVSERKDNSISGTMAESWNREIGAKIIWKGKMQDEKPSMITKPDGNLKCIGEYVLSEGDSSTWHGESVVVHDE